MDTAEKHYRQTPVSLRSDLTQTLSTSCKSRGARILTAEQATNAVKAIEDLIDAKIAVAVSRLQESGSGVEDTSDVDRAKDRLHDVLWDDFE